MIAAPVLRLAAASPLLLALGACGQVQGSLQGPPPPGTAEAGRPVTALGRIKPKHGLLRIAGPSDPVVVIARLFVEEGDVLREGQRLAVLDTFEQRQAALAQSQALLTGRQADVQRLQAELENARAEHERQRKLRADGLVTSAEIETAELRVHVAAAALTRARAEITSAEADLRRAQVELDRARVRAPVDARVLKIYARAGERVGTNGIAELARTDGIYAVAEVYETDVARVRVGQRAVVRSTSVAGEWAGTVERIGMVEVLIGPRER
jgi:HlyD family secretion protein